MYITQLEIRNFRRLVEAVVGIEEQTTIFVGANNSGKTTAITALRKFLNKEHHRSFEFYDFSATHWDGIGKIGETWIGRPVVNSESELKSQEEADAAAWSSIVPTLVVRISTDESEAFRLRRYIPDLNWMSGELEIELRFEPEDVRSLREAFVLAYAERANGWPENLVEFLRHPKSKNINKFFAVRTYKRTKTGSLRLNDRHTAPEGAPATARAAPTLFDLLAVHEIPAHRGFSDEGVPTEGGPLSKTLRRYYERYVKRSLSSEDQAALNAIRQAEATFNLQLKDDLKEPLEKLSNVGYPGMANPNLHIATQLSPIDGLRHEASIQYALTSSGADVAAAETIPCLPENYSGVGYQNLIAMIFELTGFRQSQRDKPLHLVLIEEPEAHLHVQVQQVFIRKAYEVLGESSPASDSSAPKRNVQLIVSTHSPHVAHERQFDELRYFRRELSAASLAALPRSTVVDLGALKFDSNNDKSFVRRHMRAHHCELLFADAAIFVEGNAERLLLPQFIGRHPGDYAALSYSYLTILEVGGSHVGSFFPLVEALAIPTLVVADLDASQKSSDSKTRKAIQPARDSGQVSSNPVFRRAFQTNSLDDLLARREEELLVQESAGCIRIAFQQDVECPGDPTSSAIPSTFEDALLLENPRLVQEASWKDKGGSTLNQTMHDAFTEAAFDRMNDALSANPVKGAEYATAVYSAVRALKSKGAFAVNILMWSDEEWRVLRVPSYIDQGLRWLERTLTRTNATFSPQAVVSERSPASTASPPASTAPFDMVVSVELPCAPLPAGGTAEPELES